jgi:Rps23 Pro-64 3,4-dihydroxylase Tpa1-like proline 4-hydroxylase
MNTEVIDNTIIIFDDLISPGVCQEIIQLVNAKGNFKKSILENETEEALEYRNCEEVAISVNPELKQVDNFVFTVFGSIVKKYLEMISIAAFGQDYKAAQNFTVSEDEGYVFIKYTPGGFYAPHIDQITQFNKTQPIRLLSIVLYLNDDFEGGETEFFFQKYKVKPKAGRIVVFPASLTHPHQGCPVVSGTKYVIATWFH